MTVQELNSDGSPRLDDNGDPIEYRWSSQFWERMQQTPVGRSGYRIKPEAAPEIAAKKVSNKK